MILRHFFVAFTEEIKKLSIDKNWISLYNKNGIFYSVKGVCLYATGH